MAARADGAIGDDARDGAAESVASLANANRNHAAVVQHPESMARGRRCAYCGQRCRGYTCSKHRDLPALDHSEG